MDYQCVVVYTVIDIKAPPLSAQEAGASNGCVGWIRHKIQRTVEVYLHSQNLTPHHAIVQGSLACLYYKQGLIDLAIETYRLAIKLEPDFPDAYCNLGNALKEKGLDDEAVDCYNQALYLCPTHVDTINNLGNVKREQGNIEEAIDLYQLALDVFPNFAAAHNNLATVFQQQGKLEEALLHYKIGIQIQPNFADAYSNMGNALRQMRDFGGALNCFNTAVELNPNYADALYNLGSMYKDIGSFHEAIQAYNIALLIRPDFPDAYCSLTYCKLVICDWDDYQQRMRHIVLIINKQLEEGDRITSVHPHHTMLYPLSNQARREIAVKYAIMIRQNARMLRRRSFIHRYKFIDRLRIGYISSDFGNHPTSHLMQSIPGLHDRTNIEVFCYALSRDDGTTFHRKIVQESENFVDLSGVKSNIAAAKRIYNDNIHILVNMNGYTGNSRNEIFAMKCAPIQVMWLGYPGTSGADYMDYIITDSTSSPMTTMSDYSEKFAYMPYTYFIGDHKNMFPHIKIRYDLRIAEENDDKCIAILNIPELIDADMHFNVRREKKTYTYENMEPIDVTINEIDIPKYVIEKTNDTSETQVCVGDVTILNGLTMDDTDSRVASGEILCNEIVLTSRQQYGLPDDVIVFCNFNQLYKIDPAIVTLWVKILEMVPNSVLWLLYFPPHGMPNLNRYLTGLGMSPRRIMFSMVASKEEHVRRGQIADVCLDTRLCNGHTTNMDVLWAGTPIVTLPGDTLASRVAASQLYAIDCPELIAKNSRDYVNIAVKLGNDAEYLKYMRAKVSRARLDSTLFDCKFYTERLEMLYQKMWQTYEQGQPPMHLR